MKLSKEEVEHIAKLARLELGPEEVERFQSELANILDYVSQLKEVDTTGVEPTAQVTGLLNNLRNDVSVASDSATRERLLSAFPDREGDYLKVKTVFSVEGGSASHEEDL